MAFSTLEASKIRQFLGYSEIYLNSISAVQDAINLVGLLPEAVTIVQTYITRLDLIDVALDLDAPDITGFSSVGTGDPEFYEGAKLKELRSIGRGICYKLSIKMGIEINADYFSTGGTVKNLPYSFSG